MAFYHLSVSIIGRSAGRSAVACAAYRAGAKLTDERYGEIHDYSPRKGISETGILAPQHAPPWVSDRERLWNAVEANERRKDAQLSREFNLAFPDGLNQEQRRELLDDFLKEQIASRGLVADWAIHRPSNNGDQRNWHAHVMTTMRSVSEEGFEPLKDRNLNRPEQLQEWREAWANLQNRAFDRYQIRDANGGIRKVDHRSYEAQGINQEATVHLGPHATAMERRGVSTDLGELNREIQANNELTMPIRRRAQNSFDNDNLTLDQKRLEAIRKAFETSAQQQNQQTQENDHTPEL